ncbi:spike base protein, RCAP_Rcc01079 family [Metabacillus halosaccharovorans]|uniref:spike base protein, RCAP_Rcc01079 family n=1 Tax=Metabacillus halosaccharovorans TaxID=930124 RepID=UPI00203D245F|nr:hypothetical protein [Metabacillus halosaccharovorans]MCM3444387.1 hypothetical protein [Metabacillus halosaccharovorans]
MANINLYSPRGGRIVRDDGTIVNEAEGIRDDGSQVVYSSVNDAITVTPSDSSNLSKGISKGFYLGASGNVKVDLASGTTITLNSLAAGVIHPIAVKKVHATGTTATGIVAVY